MAQRLAWGSLYTAWSADKTLAATGDTTGDTTSDTTQIGAYGYQDLNDATTINTRFNEEDIVWNDRAHREDEAAFA